MPCSTRVFVAFAFLSSVSAFHASSGRIVRPLPLSALSALSAHPEEINSFHSIDPAPCFDGICSSDPDADAPSGDGLASPSRVGEAISRLGLSTGPTVWSEFGRLAAERPSLANLGQGFPNWLPPPFATASLAEAAVDAANSPHQYTRTAGHPALVCELAKRYSVHVGRELDPMAEVCVTVGASQALYLALQTLVAPGDEVVVFEPYFDLYLNQIKLAGGTPVFVPLTFVPYDDKPGTIAGGEWVLEEERLRAVISPRTRAILLNSPHNPTGKIFSRKEMTAVADAAIAAGPDCVVLSDEVYKYIVHAPGPDTSPSRPAGTVHQPEGHVHFASLPNMWERTLTVSSAGKTFSATGWQVGWCVGPPSLVGPIQRLLPYVQFCASTVIQESLARALPRADEPYRGFPSYYDWLRADYTRKRDLLASALRAAGFAVPDYSRTAGGGFFIFARIGPEVAEAMPKDRVGRKDPAAPGGVARKDWALCRWMAEEKGVLCIPAGPFFSPKSVEEGRADEFVRVAFCKTDETIEEAARALLKLRGQGQGPKEEPKKINGAEANTLLKEEIAI